MCKIPILPLLVLPVLLSSCAGSKTAEMAGDPTPAAMAQQSPQSGQPQSAQPQQSSQPKQDPQPTHEASSRVKRKRRLDPVVQALPAPRSLEVLAKTPLYEFRENEVDLYLRDLHRRIGDPRARLVHLARKNLGQRYEIFCLGEFPFETHDPDPLYALDRGDCVTFAEQMYAMALSSSWDGFFSTLMRIRYKDAKIGVATRNHYTEADWNPNNAWLFTDVTDKLGAKTEPLRMTVDRARMLKKQFGLEVEIATEKFETTYVPASSIDAVSRSLEEGDIVEVVKGSGSGRWVGHVGLFVRGPNGEPHFLHSTSPMVKEESLPGYAKRYKGKVFGFKFLRYKSPLSTFDFGNTKR
ncbi:MAG: DUF1460 domain-containing protein [Deltaproteobacteria bacterium]|nr:MAG: DUF1460 domain-containing protein [Deltaproteobacteria bacterium]